MPLYGSSVEYGLHCLIYLVNPPAPAGGDAGETALAARDLAEFQGVSPSLVAKVFTKLQRAGLVESVEGKKGGYRLARDAAQISVLDVVDAIEGDKPLFDCKQIQGQCAVLDEQQPAATARGACMIHTVMLEAEQAMRRSLRSYTLAAMAQGMTASMPPRFMNNMEAWFSERMSGRAGRVLTDDSAGFLPANEVRTSARRGAAGKRR